MKFPIVTPIETEHLILRRVHPEDLEHYHCRLTSDPEVFRHLLGQHHNNIALTAAKIQQICSSYETRDRCHWAIALKEDDSLIGTIALLGFEEAANSCSFAYMLGKAFWGQGYGTEALKAVFRFAFEEMEIGSISADHFADNPASGAVMRKAGMRQVGFLPGKYEKNGVQYDAVAYKITREEWDSL